MIRIVYIDRFQLNRDGLAIAINKHPNMEVVGSGCDSKEAFYLIEKEKPDILITSFAWKDYEHSFQFLPALKELHPTLKIILLTMHFRRDLALKIIEEGVVDSYLVKFLSTEEIYNSILKLMDGISICYYPCKNE